MSATPGFEGKAVLITGGARNIGRELAQMFAREGAAVTVNSRSARRELDETVALIRAAGGRAAACVADITDPQAVARMVETAVKQFGGLDILINNAVTHTVKPFQELAFSDWRRTLIVLAAAGVCAGSGAKAASTAKEPAYPARPIRFIVPQPPSGTVDILARIIGQKLAEALGQPVVIDNRPGASGTVGSDLVAKARPDGYTILMTLTSHTTTPSMYAKLPYDAIKDFAPVSMVTSAPLILLVNPAVPARNVKELIALAKSKPGQLNFTAAAIGSGGHLAGELLKAMGGFRATYVNYRGTGPAIVALLANEVQFMFAGLLPAQVQIKASKLRAIAVTSAKRSALVPDLPTVAESGLPGFEVIGWYGVLAPARTPPAIVRRLNTEIVRVLGLHDVREQIIGQGAEVVGDTPEQFEAFLEADIARWAPVIKASGARAE